MKMWSKLRVLLWKDMCVRRRKFILTLAEIFIPLFPVVALVMVETRISGLHRTSAPFASEPLAVEQLWVDSAPIKLFWAPSNQFLEDIILRAASKMGMSYNNLEEFENEDSLLLKRKKALEDTRTLAVIFENMTIDENATSLSYRLRSSQFVDTSHTSPALPLAGPHEQYARVYETIVSVQMAIDLSYIEKKSGVPINTSLSLQQFPYPAYEHDELFWTKFRHLLPITLSMGQLFLLLGTVSRLVNEKVSGIKELVKMVGVSSRLQWMSQYINSIIPQIVVIIIQVCLLKLGSSPLMPQTDVFIVLVTLLLFTNYVIWFSFAFSALFVRSLVAMVLASILWDVSLAVAITPALSLSAEAILPLSWLPNMPIFWLFQILGLQELEGKVGWEVLLAKPRDSILNVVFLWAQLLLQAVIYGFLAWYFEQVMPGSHGVASPPYFIFTKKFWCPQRVSPLNTEELEQPLSTDNQDYDYYEPLGRNIEEGISIQNVWKVFGGYGEVQTTALGGVTMGVPRGGITVLLGHNGAGKTTLMSIITGVLQATRGKVVINGGDPQKSVGLCPQHNITFSHLTLMEHLLFFGMLKEMDYPTAAAQGAEVLRRLQLEDKGSWLCEALSGGQRRRAQLALALTGRPSLLVLDEPTTGLDPQARRQLWDILLEIRQDHTILITTHFMEEADVLGDRVAILDHGQLRCYGTSMFLKKAFGTGYVLTVVLENSESTNTVQRMVEEHLSAERLEGGGGLRWRLKVPSPGLPKLFRALEQKKADLRISSMGLALTTLEEVFLKVTEGIADDAVSQPESNDLHACEGEIFFEDQFYTGVSLFFTRLWALIHKKILYFNSTKISQIVQLLLVTLMFIISSVSQEKSGWVILPLRLAPPPHPRPLLVPYATNGTSPPPELARLAAAMDLQLEPWKNPDIYQGILEEGERHPSQGYTGPLIVALDLYPSHYRAFYSTSVYHGLPAAAALLTNLLALQLPGPAPLSAPPLRPSFHPLALGVAPHSEEEKTFFDVMYWTSCLTIGCFLLVASVLAYSVLENERERASLLCVSGASSLLGYLACLLADAGLCGAIAALLLLLGDALDPWPGALPPLLLLVLLHLLAAINFAYCLSLLVRHPAAGYIVLFLITIFLGLIVSLVLFTSALFEDSGASLMGGLAVLVPPHALSHGLLCLGFSARENSICLARAKRFNHTTPCCGRDEVTGECTGLLNYFSHEVYGINYHVLYTIIGTFLYAGIFFLYKYGMFQLLWERIWNSRFQCSETSLKDEYVIKEEAAVKAEMSSNNKNSAILLDSLAKNYWKSFRRSHTAVNGISFSIKKGECFGLLGANGAGKSSTFGMVVGSLVPTRGKVYRKELGYCPQFEALDGYLTGRQALKLFCSLRGYRSSRADKFVNRMLKVAGLSAHADVMNCKYSGGSRRKLSTLIALLGTGSVLLDEPSSGVDPLSRRALHALINGARTSGRSVLLSSHSMEECETLVGRLAVIKKGSLVCLGPVQALKEKYGSGFVLSLRLRPTPRAAAEDVVDSASDIPMTLHGALETRIRTLKSTILEAFPCQLKDQHLTILQYHINDKQYEYSELFSRMEDICHQNDDILEDYTISDTTLEQVFLALSN